MSDVLVTLDNLPTLSAQVYGDDNPWGVGGSDGNARRIHIGGLYDVNIRANDLTRDHGEGDVLGFSTNGPTIVTIPIFIADSTLTVSEVLDALDDLHTAWSATDPDDLASLTIVQWGHTYSLLGASAGLKVNDGQLFFTDVRAQCSFKVDPLATGS